MINALKVRLSLGSTNAPSLPNGSTKPDAGENNHTTVDYGQRSPSRTRKRAIDQAPYQESVAARELRIFYNRNKLCNSFKKVLSSSAGLFIVLLLYICLGAVLFQQFERVEETKARDALNQERHDTVTKNIESCNDDSECIVRKIIEWEKKLLENYPVFYIINEDAVWTFENAFYFCFTTISTIGYGTITPRTPIGRISCIFYAIVGIPLMLLFIADVGTALARWAKICAIAIKQNRKRTTAFKEAAKASLRRHLKPQKNNSSPEAEENDVDTTALKQPEDDTAGETPSLHILNETEDVVGSEEFWVKMHLPKRSLSMTTQDSQSFDNDDGHYSEDESDASEGSSHCSTGTESKDGSLDTLKIGDNHVGDTETDLAQTEDVFDVENGTSSLPVEEDTISNEMQDLLGDLTHKCSIEEVNSSCKGTTNCQTESRNMQNDCKDTTQTRKPSPMMRRQSSRVGFGDVIDLQSGKRTSIQNRRILHSANSGDDERSSLGGEIIENPLAETDEEGEADKLLKPKGFSFSSSPRRNAVFIPGSDTSPSSPPTSPDMGGRKSQGNAPSRRRSSITRRMGMAFGSISAVSDREVAHFSFPAWLALLLLIIYLLFGAGIVSRIDQWGFVDSFYFSFISLSTIGFGDLTPKKSWIFSFLYTFLGMCFTSMCMSLSSKELTRLLKKLAWKVGYYKSRQWKGSVRAFVKDKRRRIHERSEHWRGSRKQKNRKRKRPIGHRAGEKVSLRTQNTSSGVEQGQDYSGQGPT